MWLAHFNTSTCEDCGFIDSVKTFKGENVCINCGCVSKFPVFVDDISYTGDGEISYGDVNDRCSAVITDDSATPVIKPKVTVPIRCVMKEALGLSDGAMASAMKIYTDYLYETGTRMSEDKHIVILAACVYIVSKARPVEEICTRLGIDTTSFHSFYKLVTARLNVQRQELTVDEGFAAVSKMLGVDHKTAVVFRNKCYKIYETAVKAPNGEAIMRQVQNTKLYSTIGFMAAQFMGIGKNEKDLYARLDITPPTVSKVRGIVMNLLTKA